MRYGPSHRTGPRACADHLGIHTRDALLLNIVAERGDGLPGGRGSSPAGLATPTHPVRGCSSVSDRQGCVGRYACAIGSGAVRSGGVQVAVWQSFRADCYLHRYRRGFSLLSVHRVSPLLDNRVRRTGGTSGMCGLLPTTTLVLCAWLTSRAVCGHQTHVAIVGVEPQGGTVSVAE